MREGKGWEKVNKALCCLISDDEEKGKLPWLWADAGCSASWWGVGPPVPGSPFSRLWRKRQMESEGSAPLPALLLQSVLLPPTPAWGHRARGTWGRRRAPSPPPTQGSTAYREGSPRRLFLPQTLCCLPVDVSNNYIFAFKSCWTQTFLHSDKTSPLKVSRDYIFEEGGFLWAVCFSMR